MLPVYLTIPLSCLAAAMIIGLGGRHLSARAAHTLAIAGVAVAFVLSAAVYMDVRAGNEFNGAVYVWAMSGGARFEIGFLIDKLSALMMVVVTGVSLLVHIYTVGYMADDPGYKRFFCYIALFTFAMLMLVMSNNFLQLFFGWEAVGLVSYLLIGFWYERERAVAANLKAFLVNRVGDFAFLLGIAAIMFVFGTLDYAAVFAGAKAAQTQTVNLGFGEWHFLTVICLLLFVGAMGKSAQMPLHVWLPDSMEGPTPISALIHAATMVTAGIFMVARMAPLFELSEAALSTALIVGATTAILMALVGLVQYDIKRVVAYSTLSQLGYMTAALGASAYDLAIFHLGAHAFFKALLFLAAGSVIIAMHHQQDMRAMGGLRTIMPITYITAAVGSLALAGIPPFAGFFSKDAIIVSIGYSERWGAGYAYAATLLGVFVTACYAFRLLFMTFHGKSRADADTRRHLRESSGTVIWPLVALAIPSLLFGLLLFESVVDGSLFGASIFAAERPAAVAAFAALYEGKSGAGLIFAAFAHGLLSAPFWLAVLGIGVAWYAYCVNPKWPARLAAASGRLYALLLNQYGFDAFYQKWITARAVRCGELLWRRVDVGLVDGGMVNGAAALVKFCAARLRHLQTGGAHHYAFAMLIGLFVLVTLFAWW